MSCAPVFLLRRLPPARHSLLFLCVTYVLAGVVCDVRAMRCFADGVFDVVIDKGTMDAVMVMRK